MTLHPCFQPASLTPHPAPLHIHLCFCGIPPCISVYRGVYGVNGCASNTDVWSKRNSPWSSKSSGSPCNTVKYTSTTSAGSSPTVRTVKSFPGEASSLTATRLGRLSISGLLWTLWTSTSTSTSMLCSPTSETRTENDVRVVELTSTFSE